MKGLKPKEEVEAKKRKTARRFSFLILFMLVVSSAGYAFLSKPDDGNSNAENIATENFEGYSVKINNINHYFIASPQSTKDVDISISFDINDYAGKEIYLDSDNDGVTYELASNLQRYVSRIQKGCYQECSENVPEKDCNSFIIVWKSSSENKVYQENRCIFIEGDMRAVDGFLYKLFGI